VILYKSYISFQIPPKLDCLKKSAERLEISIR